MYSSAPDTVANRPIRVWGYVGRRLFVYRDRQRDAAHRPGEMLDWEAPTRGYLLQAPFSMGVTAARGALEWLRAGATS